MKLSLPRILFLAALLVCLALCCAPLFAQSQAAVAVEVHHDRLPALRDIPAVYTPGTNHDHKVRPVPMPRNTEADAALQSRAYTASMATPTVSLGFEGVGLSNYGVNSAPPDTNGAAGTTQYVEWVNEAFAVFDKTTGHILYGPANGNTLWSGFGGGCQSNNDGDPIVKWDRAAQVWVMMQFSVSTTPYLQCVAVSKTADATGGWYRYSFQYSNFPDYPKAGVWSDGYYVTFNMFNGNSFAGAMLCAYNRSAMLNGTAATQVCKQLTSSYGGVLPADADGATAPPTGAPGIFVNYGSSKLNLWTLAVNWTNNTGTLTGPTAIPVASFTAACNGGTCIPQSGTSQQLDSLADRLMYRLAYRNFGTYQSLVVNHSVKISKSVPSGVRWYELRNTGSAWTVHQQATYSPDSSSRWMGSIAQDKMGDIAVGYSVSSKGMFPAIRYAGRAVTDPLNTLQTETAALSGGGSQTRNLNRWGDYSAMSIDPVDDCTFWYTNEYLSQNGTFNWSTRIFSFKFPNCQ